MRKKYLIGLLMLFVLVGCAVFNGKTELTPKRQGVIWMGIYNAEYDDCMYIMNSPSATSGQKQMAQKKKVLLGKIWPLLKIYVSVIDGGGTVSLEDTQTLTVLINQLTALAGGE